MHADHGGESHGRPRQLVQLGLSFRHFLRGAAQRLDQRMVLGHELVVGLLQRRERLFVMIVHVDLAFQHVQPSRIPIVLMISDNRNHA